jgi:hypothetical protein
MHVIKSCRVINRARMALMMEAEIDSETADHKSIVIRLFARQDTEFIRRKSFKPYSNEPSGTINVGKILLSVERPSASQGGLCTIQLIRQRSACLCTAKIMSCKCML